MSKSQDRENLAQIICKAAKIYKKNLVGQTFLYVFDNRYIEVIFKKHNYKHLTGVSTTLSAKDFYKNAVTGKLKGKQIWFDADHPYDLCCRKIQRLADIPKMTNSECIMLEEITAKKCTFKFGTTNLDFTLCLDREYDDNGNVKGDCYVVKSLRSEDCFSKSKNVYEISHILSRPNDKKLYSNILYVDKKTDLNNLPQDVIHMLDDTDILYGFSPQEK